MVELKLTGNDLTTSWDRGQAPEFFRAKLQYPPTRVFDTAYPVTGSGSAYKGKSFIVENGKIIARRNNGLLLTFDIKWDNGDYSETFSMVMSGLGPWKADLRLLDASQPAAAPQYVGLYRQYSATVTLRKE